VICRLRNLLRCDRGGAAIEFAVLAPLLFTMLLGVLQIGISLQSYNALRGIAADVSRHVAVEYQNANQMPDEQIRLYGTSVAVQPPYMLDSERVIVSVAPAPVQRIPGAREMTFTVAYSIPSVLSIIDLPEVTVSFTRPIFVPAQPVPTPAGESQVS
jgi:Flp pilus assembly pilin Flp